MSVPKSIARPEQFPRHFLHEEVAGSQTGCKYKSQPYESQRHICLGVTHRFAQSRGSHKCPFLPSAWISEEFSSSALYVGPQGSPLLLCSLHLLSAQTPWGPRRELSFQASASVKNLCGFHFWTCFLNLGIFRSLSSAIHIY